MVADQLGGVRALADSAGVFESTVHAWLRNAEPNRITLKKIANASNVSLDWLVSGEGNIVPLRFHDLQKSQGYNETFIARDEAETRLFDLSVLTGAPQLEYLQRPSLAQRDLSMILVGGLGDSMAPLICDADLVVGAIGKAMDLYTPTRRSVTYPFVMSHHGRVVVRFIRYERGRGINPLGRTAIGPIEKSNWPPKMGEPEKAFDGYPLPGGEYFLIGRVIWCGRSLLGFDFS